MNPNVILPIVGLFWMGSELLLIVFCRVASAKDNRDAGSIVWLNAVIYGSIILAVLVSFTSIGLVRNARPALAWVGLVLISIGLVIRWLAIITLRRFFTVQVVIQDDHQISRNGIYRIVRHPSYLGSLVSFLGLATALSNWLSFAIIILPITSAFLARIKIEERALSDAFGQAYREYCKSTWKLLPLIY
jgi:protein-S-isoprenylcysteine O-methyltransferase